METYRDRVRERRLKEDLKKKRLKLLEQDKE